MGFTKQDYINQLKEQIEFLENNSNLIGFSLYGGEPEHPHCHLYFNDRSVAKYVFVAPADKVREACVVEKLREYSRAELQPYVLDIIHKCFKENNIPIVYWNCVMTQVKDIPWIEMNFYNSL